MKVRLELDEHELEEIIHLVKRLTDSEGDQAATPAAVPSVESLNSDLRAAALAFRRRAGLGCDFWHPRWLALLSDAALEAWIDFFVLLELLELVGSLPRAVFCVLGALIPKLD